MYSSGGIIFGGGVMSCFLEDQECKHGFRTTAEYDGVFWGFTIGAVPFGMTYFTMMFDVYDVDSLSGRASILTHTTALGGGVGFGQICLGSGCTDFDMSPAIGFDASFDAFEGYGRVHNKSLKCCG
jgi:hypothetical protein